MVLPVRGVLAELLLPLLLELAEEAELLSFDSERGVCSGEDCGGGDCCSFGLGC